MLIDVQVDLIAQKAEKTTVSHHNQDPYNGMQEELLYIYLFYILYLLDFITARVKKKEESDTISWKCSSKLELIDICQQLA